MRSRPVLGQAFLLVGLICGCQQEPGVATGPKPDVTEPAPPKDGPAEDPRKIVAQAMEASGGADKFGRWVAGKVKYTAKGKLFAEIPGAKEYVVEESFDYPDRFKRVTRANVGGKEIVSVYVVNGKKVWNRRPDGTVEELNLTVSAKECHDFGRMCDITPLAGEDVKLTTLGEHQVEGRPAVAVRAEFEDHGAFDMSFDKETRLLVRTRQSPPKVEVILGDYKDIQGGKVPARIKMYDRGNLALDVRLTEIRFEDEVDEKEFARP